MSHNKLCLYSTRLLANRVRKSVKRDVLRTKVLKRTVIKRRKVNEEDHKGVETEMSVLDLKAHYHGLKYVKEVFKLLPYLANDYLIKMVSSRIANLGAIHPSKEVA